MASAPGGLRIIFGTFDEKSSLWKKAALTNEILKLEHRVTYLA
jgi:hypothetical protein